MTSGATTAKVQAAEASRLLAAAPKGAWLVALDERGEPWSSPQLAERIGRWQQQGRDVAFLVGGADGLDPADYPVPEFGTFSGAEAYADGDIRLTNSMLTYARNLAVGRIAPTRVLVEVDYGNHTPEPADILKKVADAGDAGRS